MTKSAVKFLLKLVIHEINKSNSKILQSLNIDPMAYNASIDAYSSLETINKKIHFTDKLLADFMRDNNFEIQIPIQLSQNFLKIVTNIFYLNLQKVAVEVKRDIFDKQENLSRAALREIISVYYDKNLKSTRKKVLQFFKVVSGDIKARTLLRAYTNLLPKDHTDRLAYIKYFEIKERIEDKLAEKVYSGVLLSDVNFEPKDEVINLETLLIN
jgi:hypothetical protein